MSNKLLTFELNNKDERLEIHLNQEGLNDLIAYLENLKSKYKDHLHLMTDTWGGNELTNEKQGKDNLLINHVKIYIW
ncbi:MAG: immunity protein 32 [Candidatus Omnitrophica bacterium]|nr:immunity protein 32 [Candidatus Omnitrophota bacterium]